jgi:hypothetical protein
MNFVRRRAFIGAAGIPVIPVMIFIIIFAE